MIKLASKSTVRSSAAILAALFWLGGVAGIWVASPATGQPRTNARAPADQDLERMFAASPQRELRRDWEECMNTAAYLMIGSGKTINEIRALLQIGCAEQESRLTGAMVREFGYDRGNSAVASLRASKLQAIERRVAARDNPPLPQSRPGQTFVERLPAGWEVYRINAGGCVAASVHHSIYGDSFVSLIHLPDGDRVVFGQVSSEATRAATRFGGAGARLRTGVSAIANNTGGGIGEMDFEIQAYVDGVGFKTVLTPRLLDIMSRAEQIQFAPTIPGMMMGIPRTFTVTGAAAAWEGVVRCAGPRARGDGGTSTGHGEEPKLSKRP